MSDDQGAQVVVVSIEFLIHHAASLKDKRRVAKSVKDRLRARFNASVAEVAYVEEWQRCGIAMALVGNDRGYLERETNDIRQFMQEIRDIELVGVSVEWV